MNNDKLSRRGFLKGLIGGGLTLPAIGGYAGSGGKDPTRLTILHTNDMHSHIEPFADDDPDNPGEGGMARRAAIIDKVRREEENVLVLDSGDIFQGTPYFNEYGGELEFKLMSEMGYDAATMGNHDLDNGLEGFEKMLEYADFPFICSNYDFHDTVLNRKTKPYKVFSFGDLKVGVIGLGIELEGLVNPALYGSTEYLDPVVKVDQYGKQLRNEENCDIVVALSHLGYSYEDERVSDLKLASAVDSVDIILGGHTHTFMEKPDVIRRKDGKRLLINQVGWAGLRIGRIDLTLNREGEKMEAGVLNIPIGAG